MIALGFSVLIASVLVIYSGRPPRFVGKPSPAASPAPSVPEDSSRSVIALSTDGTEEIIRKLGCANCHQIPGIPWRNGAIGPILIEKTLAPRRLASTEYQRRVRSGLAHAKSERDYVRESIVSPDSFIAPHFAYDPQSGHSAMYSGFDRQISYSAMEKLIDYLLTLDCDSARKDGMIGPPSEPVSAICEH